MTSLAVASIVTNDLGIMTNHVRALVDLGVGLLHQLDHWDPLDRLDRVGSQDFLVSQGLMGYPATMGILEDLVQKETRVLKDTLGLLASQVLGESREILAKGDSKGTRETKE